MTSPSKTCYRPTVLKLAHQHCPRAVDYYEQRRPYFRDHYAVGIVAHDGLAKVGELANLLQRPPELGEAMEAIDKAVRTVMTDGRTFEDEREPPVSAEVAEQGRTLAARYVTEHPLSPTAMYERGAAFTSNWQPLADYYSPGRRFRLIFDRVDILDEEGEEYSARVVTVTDYKSAWSTDASELETYQMKAQAVAAHLLYGREVDMIRREVANLRSGEVHREEIWLEQGGGELLAAWRAEISRAMDALDHMAAAGARPARPGPGCMGCPWLKVCPDAADLLADLALIGDAREPMHLARTLAVADAAREQTIPLLKLRVADGLVREDDLLYGWHAVEKREPLKDAGVRAWETWQAAGGDLAGFLKATPLGVTALQALARVLRKGDRAGQEELLSSWTQLVPRREFGAKKAS